MTLFVQIVGTLALIVVLACLIRARRDLLWTTLRTVWHWLCAAVAVWAAAWVLTGVWQVVHENLADLLWYAAAVVMLCPFIAVLGARRPTSRVWAIFVLLPLLFVLGLPVMTAWSRDGQIGRIQLEAPACLGYALVLVMGVGNYCGTRFTREALLTGSGLLLLVLPLSTWGAGLSDTSLPMRAGATVCLALAGAGAAYRVKHPPKVSRPLDRLWVDFRDYFGIVWARRIQDRVNAAAEKDRWPARLEMHGFAWLDDEPPRTGAQSESEQIEHTLRWLLRRFVDPEWIDERLAERDIAADHPE